jgi:hypothetical protein
VSSKTITGNGCAGDSRDENNSTVEFRIVSGIKLNQDPRRTSVDGNGQNHFSLKAFLKRKVRTGEEAFKISKVYIGLKCIDDYERFEKYTEKGIDAVLHIPVMERQVDHMRVDDR